jgi:hypothetical protein
MIVVATWPLMLRLERAFGGRRGPAVAVMSLGLLAILVVPLVVAIDAVIGQADAFVALLERLPSHALPAAPAWLDKVPLAGDRLQATWDQSGGRGHGRPDDAGAAALPRTWRPGLAAGRQFRNGHRPVHPDRDPRGRALLGRRVLGSWARGFGRAGRRAGRPHGRCSPARRSAASPGRRGHGARADRARRHRARDRGRSVRRGADGDHVRALHRATRATPGAAGAAAWVYYSPARAGARSCWSGRWWSG